jgi:hypothetical protein
MSTTEAPKNLPPVSTWLVGTLRLTAFASPTARVSGVNWWHDIVGKPSEAKLTQAGAGEVEAGHYRNGNLILTVNPTRIDWQYTGQTDPAKVVSGISDITVGRLPETLSTFVNLMTKWLGLKSIPPVVRLAFGAVLVRPEKSEEAVYESLSRYIPVDQLSGDIAEFLYQINRRRYSGVQIPGLRINRLSKWSLIQVQQQIASAITPSAVYHAPALYGALLELDMNTVAEFQGKLPRLRLPKLWAELANLGKEIAEKGDIS